MKYYLKPLSIILSVSIVFLDLSACAPLVIASAASGVAVLTDRRTTGTYIEDKAIELKAYKLLSEDRNLASSSNLSVTCYNERVLITGQAASDNVKNQAENVIKNIPKVKTVYNEIQIAEKDGIKKSSYDSWISTKVKTNLASDLRVNPLDIKVTTADKVVYLMGLVTPNESEIATDIARKVYGVNKVVKLFEYVHVPNTQLAQNA